MGRNDGRVTHAEAAEILDVTERHLRHMVRQGIIKPVKLGSSTAGHLYAAEEVNAILEARLSSTSLPAVARTALQAQALSRSISGKLDIICRFLGLENNRLSYDEEAVRGLLVRVQETLKEDFSELRSGAIVEWAATFNSFDEPYLQVVADILKTDNPWVPYLALANDLMVKRSRVEDSNLTFAYACLDAARRNLRHVAYFYVLAKHGIRTANNLFTKDAVNDEIIAQLYPTTVEMS